MTNERYKELQFGPDPQKLTPEEVEQRWHWCPEMDQLLCIYGGVDCFCSEVSMNEHNITTEKWREYDFPGRPEPYRITEPVKLFYRTGGATHRILDKDDVVHCVPAPGECGCVLRWANKDKSYPVEF